MRICYALLSPTFGMHQYTADIANRMAYAGHEVHLVTTTFLPRDRYAPMVNTHTPLNLTPTGFQNILFANAYAYLGNILFLNEES